MSTVTQQNDVKSLVKSLEALQANLKTLKQPADAVAGLVDDLDQALTKPQELVKVLDRLKDLMNDIAATLGLVSAPLEELGIGEVLDAISEVLEDARPVIGDIDKILDEIIKSTITPLQGPVHKLKAPTDAVDKVIDTLTEDVEKWAPTVETISEAIDLADAISNLIGGKFAQDIQKIADVYNQGARDISGLLSGLDTVLADINSLIGKMETFFDDIKTPLEDFAQIVEKVTTGLSPFQALENMLDEIKNAIKPVQWALDAVKKVFDKVIAPLLNPFLKPLEDLVENQVKKALHLDAMQKNIQNLEKQLGLGDILSNTEALFGKVADLTQTKQNIEQKLGTFAAPSLQAQIENLLKELEGSLARQSAEVTGVRAGVPPDGGDALQPLLDLESELQTIPMTIRGMRQPATSLGSLIASLDTVRAAPADLKSDLVTFTPMLNEVVQMLQFVGSLPVLKDFVPAFAGTLAKFQAPVTSLGATVDKLQNSVQATEQALDTLTDPLNDVSQGLHGLKEDVNTWIGNLQSIQAEMRLANVENRKCQNKFSPQIQALQDQINQACTAIKPTVDTFLATLGAIGGNEGSIAQVTSFLDTYRTQLTTISTQAASVNRTLTFMEQAKPRIDQAYAVMQPLQWLVQASCNQSTPSGGVQASAPPAPWQTFESYLETALSGVETLLQKTVNHLFPVSDLNASMQQVMGTIDQSSPTWTSNVGKLKSQLASLASGRDNVTGQLDNLFSQDYQQKLSQLEKGMVAALHG